jgi:hypothetical protein
VFCSIRANVFDSNCGRKIAINITAAPARTIPKLSGVTSATCGGASSTASCLSWRHGHGRMLNLTNAAVAVTADASAQPKASQYADVGAK